MRTIAAYDTIEGDTYRVTADGGYAVLEHLDPSGYQQSLIEGETCAVVEYFSTIVMDDVADGTECMCGEIGGDCRNPDCIPPGRCWCDKLWSQCDHPVCTT